MRIAIGFLFGALLCVLAGSPGHLTKQTAHAEAAARKVATQQRVVQSQPENVATASQPAPQTTDDIPGRVFCGTPAQRNWKNIVVPSAAMGKQMAAERGWTGGEWLALLELWSCESSWTATAVNPHSGAGGIPQSWPADKMASAGADWKTNPATQIKWGLKYIADRYGKPSAALAFHYANNWY